MTPTVKKKKKDTLQNEIKLSNYISDDTKANKKFFIRSNRIYTL